MRFSLFYDFDVLPRKEPSELYREIEAQTIVADGLGFDGIWLAEPHVEPYGSLPSPFLYLARLSSLTRSIELGTTIVETSYYHPLKLAEDIALLDIISQGRVRLGIGSGAINTRLDLASGNTSLDTKTARMLEMVAILRQAFDEGCVDFVGNYYRYQGVELLPRPLQPAQNLIWIAATHATPELAGVAGYNLLIPSLETVTATQQFLNRYRTYLAGKPGFIAQLHFVYVASCEREAQEQMHRILAHHTHHTSIFEWDGQTDNREYEALSRRLNVIVGTPSHVAEQLTIRQQEYGINEIACQVYSADMQHEDVLRSITLLGQEVLPRLQQPYPMTELAIT